MYRQYADSNLVLHETSDTGTLPSNLLLSLSPSDPHSLTTAQSQRSALGLNALVFVDDLESDIETQSQLQ